MDALATITLPEEGAQLIKQAMEFPVDVKGVKISTPEESQAAVDQCRDIKALAKLDDIRTHLRGIRRQVWSLLADLENLAGDQLRELEHDLALLDAAAHTATQMVERVEVVA